MKDKDIIEKSQVSAASFYKYYSDKSEVLDDLENDLMAKFRKAVAKDIKHWQTMNHSPSKKDMDRLIDQNINELINFATENHEYVSTLLSRNGEANFQYRIIEYSTKMIERAIIYYYSLYHQERLLSKQNAKLQFISRQYALAFLEPLLIWQHHSDQMTVRDIKSMIKLNVMKSPYELSPHGL